MGEETDLLIERMLSIGYMQPPEKLYHWETQLDSRLGPDYPHAPNCRCAMTDGVNTHCVQNPPPIKEVKRLSIERAFKQASPFEVPSHIICKRCQATGLHWGLRDGKPEMREEGGWPHKCKKIEGVTLNLPNILDPQ